MRRFLKKYESANEKKKELKRITLLFTPSALEKWNYEYRVETDKKGNENEKKY